MVGIGDKVTLELRDGSQVAGKIVTITKKVEDTGKSALFAALIGISVIGVATADYSWGEDEWEGTWEGGIMTH